MNIYIYVCVCVCLCVCVCIFLPVFFWLRSFHSTLDREHRLNIAWEKGVEKNIWTNSGEGMLEKAGKM